MDRWSVPQESWLLLLCSASGARQGPERTELQENRRAMRVSAAGLRLHTLTVSDHRCTHSLGQTHTHTHIRHTETCMHICLHTPTATWARGHTHSHQYTHKRHYVQRHIHKRCIHIHKHTHKHTEIYKNTHSSFISAASMPSRLRKTRKLRGHMSHGHIMGNTQEAELTLLACFTTGST